MWHSKYFFQSSVQPGPQASLPSLLTSSKIEAAGPQRRVSVSLPSASSNTSLSEKTAKKSASAGIDTCAYPANCAPTPGPNVFYQPTPGASKYAPVILRRPCANGVCTRSKLSPAEDHIIDFLSKRRSLKDSQATSSASATTSNATVSTTPNTSAPAHATGRDVRWPEPPELKYEDDIGFYAIDDQHRLFADTSNFKSSTQTEDQQSLAARMGEMNINSGASSSASTGTSVVGSEEFASAPAGNSSIDQADGEKASSDELPTATVVSGAPVEPPKPVVEDPAVVAQRLLDENMRTLSSQYFRSVCGDLTSLRSEQESLYRALFYDTSFLILQDNDASVAVADPRPALVAKGFRSLLQLGSQPRLLLRLLQRAPEFLLAVLRLLTKITTNTRLIADDALREPILNAVSFLAQAGRYLQSVSYNGQSGSGKSSVPSTPTSPEKAGRKDVADAIANEEASNASLEDFRSAIQSIHFTLPAVMAFLDSAWSVSDVMSSHLSTFCCAFRYLTSICRSQMSLEDGVDAKTALRRYGVVTCSLRYVLASASPVLRRDAMQLLIAFGDASIATEFQVAVLDDDMKLGTDLLADIRSILDDFSNYVEEEEKRLLFMDSLRLVSILARHPQNRQQLFNAKLFPPLFKIVDHFHKNTLRVGSAYVHVQIQRMAMEIMGFWFPLDSEPEKKNTSSAAPLPAAEEGQPQESSYRSQVLELFFEEALPILLLVLDHCTDRYVRKAASFALAHLSEHRNTHWTILEKSLLPDIKPEAPVATADPTFPLPNPSVRKRPLLTLCEAGDFSALVVVANVCENVDVFRQLRSKYPEQAYIVVVQVCGVLVHCLLKYGNVGFFPQVSSTALAHVAAMELPLERDALGFVDVASSAEDPSGDVDDRVFDGDGIRMAVSSLPSFSFFLVRSLTSYLNDAVIGLSVSSTERKEEQSPLVPRNLSLILLACSSVASCRAKFANDAVLSLLLKSVQLPNKKGFSVMDPLVHRNLMLSLCYYSRDEKYSPEFLQKTSARAIFDLLVNSKNVSDMEPYLLCLLGELARDTGQHVYFRTPEHASLLLALLGTPSVDTKYGVLRILSVMAPERRSAEWMLREGIIGRVWQVRESPNKVLRQLVESILKVIQN